MVAKHPDGPYTQFRRLNLGASGEKVRLEKVKNKTDEVQSVVLAEGTDGDGEYTTTYRSRGANITDDVTSSGYDFVLAPGAKRIIRVKVAGQGSTEPLCLGLRAEDSAHDIQFAGFAINIALAGCLES